VLEGRVSLDDVPRAVERVHDVPAKPRLLDAIDLGEDRVLPAVEVGERGRELPPELGRARPVAGSDDPLARLRGARSVAPMQGGEQPGRAQLRLVERDVLETIRD